MPVKPTIDRKLQIGDTTYVLRVPKETSLDVLEIINKGRILMVKSGAMVAQDINGNIMGRSGSAWNPNKPILAEPSKEITDALHKAIHRTRNLIEADQKHPEGKLPRLFSIKYQKETIKRDESVPRYYIASQVYCANCKEPIYGTQTIHPNANGMVGSADPFEPYPNTAVPHVNGSKKWLHLGCEAKHTDVPVTEDTEFEKALKERSPVVPLNMNKEETLRQTLQNILIGSDHNAEFARGAAWMYLEMTK